MVLVAWPRVPESKVKNTTLVPPTTAPYWWKNFVEAVPVRICAFHICTRNGGQFFKIVLSMIGAVLTKERIRMKIHSGKSDIVCKITFGSYYKMKTLIVCGMCCHYYINFVGDKTEISYQLLGYGIPVDLMPLTDSGNVKTKNLAHWLKVRKVVEDNRSMHGNGVLGRFFLNNIECPSLNDVIFRSGKNHMSHPGNVMFQGIIESKHAEHCAAHQDDKAVITWWVVEQVESKGGRFLEWNDDGMWSQIMDRGQIRSKVSSCFRTYRRKLNAFRNNQQSDSATSTFIHQQYHGNKRRKLDLDKICNDNDN